MGSVGNILGIGANGLLAQQAASSVASQNAANSATPGYSRRAASLETVGPPPAWGQGVRMSGASRRIDPFVERRLLGAVSADGAAQARSGVLQVLDEVASPEGGGIAEALAALREALLDLSTDPSEPSVREVALQRADAMSWAFRRAAEAIAEARQEAKERIEAALEALGERAQRVAELNGQISKAEVGGQEAAALRDERDGLLRQMASEVPIKVLEQPDGRVSVHLAGGPALVTADGRVNPLQARLDPATDALSVTLEGAGADVDVTGLLSGGRVGGLLEAREGDLKDAADRLDRLAFDTASAYNAVHAAGFGLDGVGGRNLFEPPAVVAGAAAAMAVSSDVSGRPEALAAAADPAAGPGDNRNALDLVALEDASFAEGGTATFEAAWSGLVSAFGSAVRGAHSEAEQTAAVAQQVQALREQVSGVSVDEEMVSLMRYQRAFQASVRVVQTADEMLAEVISMKR